MVWKKTYGIDNTHGVDLNSWYSIGTPESNMYERAECCPYAGVFLFGYGGQHKGWGQILSWIGSRA